MTDPAPTGWRCSWADFRGYRERGPEKPPPTRCRDFDTRSEAEEEARRQRALGAVASVTAIYPVTKLHRGRLPPGPWPVERKP